MIKANPFRTIDDQAVGQMVGIGVKRARDVCPFVVIGVTGEHTSDARYRVIMEFFTMYSFWPLIFVIHAIHTTSV